MDLRVRTSDMSEEAAYKLTYPMASARWPASPEFPSNSCIEFYDQIKSHTDYFAVCGARGCIVACSETLEKRGCIEQCNFKTAMRPRPHWQMPPPEKDRTGGIAEGRFPKLYNQPDNAPGKWD